MIRFWIAQEEKRLRDLALTLPSQSKSRQDSRRIETERDLTNGGRS